MNIPEVVIPREHGAWAVLIVPMLVGASIAGGFSAQFCLLLISALGIFLSYMPGQTLLRHLFLQLPQGARFRQARFWVPVYLSVSVVCATPLLVQGFWLLLAFGGAGVIMFLFDFILTRSKSPRTVQSDLFSVAGLTLGAPAAYYVTTGSLDKTAFLAWVLNFLFFGCSVFYVQMKIRAFATKKTELSLKERLALGRLNLLYHFVVIAIVAALSAVRLTAHFAILAFVPMTIHAVYGTYRLSGRVRFRNLGLALLTQSAVFAMLLGYFYA